MDKFVPSLTRIATRVVNTIIQSCVSPPSKILIADIIFLFAVLLQWRNFNVVGKVAIQI